MAKNVVVISTSLRKNSNSDALAVAFADGAKSAGHNVEIIRLSDKQIAFCKGCFACFKLGSCVIKDDAPAITDKIGEADVVVWATPIYYYEMCGQMKTMIDRANALWVKDYKFRDVYFLSAAAEPHEGVDARAIGGVEGWIACFPKSRLAGTVFAGGVKAPGDIEGSEALIKAFNMGAAIEP